MPLATLVAALILTLPAGCALLHFWRRVPMVAVRARFFPRQRQQEAYRLALRTPRALAAYRLQQASKALTAALTGTCDAAALANRLDAALAGPVPSQLGRLQRAAARLWEVQQAGAPPAQQWPAVRTYLEGIERADFAHFEQDLATSLAAQYRAAGIGPGTACVLAQWAIGSDHGPFLEWFTENLDRLIRERAAAGDAAAAETCRRVRNRLLRQWVLDPGPATLRLLAADLLADSLERDETAPEAPSGLRRSLRQWRGRYRSAIARRPLAALAAYRKPALAPRESETLVARAALTVWLAAALVVAALAAVVTAPGLLRRREGDGDARRAIVTGFVAAGAVLVAGLVWIGARPEQIRADFRADFSALRYWPVSPLLAGGLTAALLLVASRVTRGAGKRRAQRLGGVAAGAWLLLAVALWAAAIASDAARRDYEQATAVACRDPIVAVLGESEATGLLAPLRAWQP